jgi:GNAT superfamily N-acetyltransferase
LALLYYAHWWMGPMRRAASTAEVRFRPETNRRTQADVFVGGLSVSHCGIVHLGIYIGRAIIPVDGIDDVWTDVDHRRQGYARQLVGATVCHMRAGDAALSVLYGISDFYPKFGYATVGYDFGIRLNELDRPSFRVPDGWSIRPFALSDLDAIQRIYERETVGTVGPAIRPPEAPVWKRLAACADPDRPVWDPYDGNTAPPARDDCRVAIDPGGGVAAYFWRGKGLNYVNLDERYFPTSLWVGEVVADSPLGADAILAACRIFSIEEATRLGADGHGPHQSIRLGVQPDSVVAAQRSIMRRGRPPTPGIVVARWYVCSISEDSFGRSSRS